MELVFVHCVDLPCYTFHTVQDRFNAFTRVPGLEISRQRRDRVKTKPEKSLGINWTLELWKKNILLQLMRGH